MFSDHGGIRAVSERFVEEGEGRSSTGELGWRSSVVGTSERLCGEERSGFPKYTRREYHHCYSKGGPPSASDTLIQCLAGHL